MFLLHFGSFSEWSWRWSLCISLSCLPRALPFSSLSMHWARGQTLLLHFPSHPQKSSGWCVFSKEAQIAGEPFTNKAWLAVVFYFSGISAACHCWLLLLPWDVLEALSLQRSLWKGGSGAALSSTARTVTDKVKFGQLILFADLNT